MTERTVYGSRAEWLEGRRGGLGASDCGIVLGVSNFKTPLQLWREKIGAVETKEISGNERIDFGNRAEEPLRAMFRLMHPEYELSFEPYLIVRQTGRYSFLTCTPDGELVERETGRRGIYESKTATCLTRADWDKWRGKVPDLYYAQICEQMFTGEYEYAVVWALLVNAEGDGEIRFYKFEKTECQTDIDYTIPKLEHFWKNNVLNGVPPAAILRL